MKILKSLLVLLPIAIAVFFGFKALRTSNLASSFDKDLQVGQRRAQLASKNTDIKIEVNSAIQQLISLLAQIGPSNIAALTCTDDVGECKASQVESNGALAWYLWALAELDPQFASPDHANKVHQAFDKMVQTQMTPPLVTLNGVLSALENFNKSEYVGYSYLQLSKQANDFGDNDVKDTSSILTGMIGLQHARGVYLLSKESNFKILKDNLLNSKPDSAKKRNADEIIDANLDSIKKLAKKIFDRLYAVGTGLIEVPVSIKPEEVKKGSYIDALLNSNNGKKAFTRPPVTMGDGKEAPHSRCWAVLVGAHILKYDTSGDIVTKLGNLIDGINLDLSKEVKGNIIPSFYLPCLEGFNVLSKNENSKKLKSLESIETLRKVLLSQVVIPSLDLKEYPVCYGIGGVFNSYNRNLSAKCSQQMVTMADSAHALIGLLPFKNQTISIN